MEELALYFRFLLGVMFLSSTYSKMKYFQEHIATVREYKIIPTSLVRPFVNLNMIAEAITGSLLLLGLFQKSTVLAAISLITLYTTAIIVNLMRGRTEISCGCGGIVGNHKISWLLVVRNCILVFICIWLTKHPTVVISIDSIWNGDPSNFFNLRILQSLLVCCTTLVFFNTIQQLIKLSKGIHTMFKN
ncbi:MauE/DoxX family redox-associated membrane protein [Brevibacillus sp. SYSU BS000544]|uniref:MauE/DoxX family redox-associated membrane protein n=1 Tax=Brevibacillus sp. SYSU BS000544 TaxID=3416443 RepID=UPI003CE45D1D